MGRGAQGGAQRYPAADGGSALRPGDGTYAGAGFGTSLEIVPIAGALAITAVAVTDVNSLICMGRQALDSMDSFSKVLLPTLAAATAAGGAPAGAAARQVATGSFLPMSS